MADAMPDPLLERERSGAAVLRQAIPILTRAQSEKLFREALKTAEIAYDLAFEDFRRWSDRQERRRQAEQPRPSNPTSAHLVLGVTAQASISEINSAWRRLAQTAHPDKGGDHARMAAINAARDAMLHERLG